MTLHIILVTLCVLYVFGNLGPRSAPRAPSVLRKSLDDEIEASIFRTPVPNQEMEEILQRIREYVNQAHGPSNPAGIGPVVGNGGNRPGT